LDNNMFPNMSFQEVCTETVPNAGLATVLPTQYSCTFHEA
jgi:hypothetical protein